MIKPPGILYRISFLVVLNSLFIFAAVTYVSFENNQSKIDRLINYRFDFISEYFRAELDDNYLAEGEPTSASPNNETLDAVFDRARVMVKGLGGLALMTPSMEDDKYIIQTASYRESLDNYDPRMWEHIAGDFDKEMIEANGIHVGRRFDVKSGSFKTIYIPWDTPGDNAVLAITFVPEEVVGGNFDYNWTLIFLFLVITLITLLIINLLFQKFIRPLRHMVQAMEKTAEGEVLCKIEDVTSAEMGRVAAAFNTMSSSLWEKRKQLTDTLVELSTANKSLSESKTFLSKLIENAPFAIIATDPDRKILIFSKAAMSIFEMRVDEALGRDIVEFFPFAPEKVFPKDGEKDRVCQEEMICRKPNQESFPALVSRVPIRDKITDISAHLFIIRDISESAGFQEMLISIDRMATRGVMAGEIAHEINNYLAIILGNVELLPLLLAKGKMDKVDRKLEVLRTTVTKIQRFSEGLMGYGNETAVFEQGDLNQLIENLVAFLKPQNRYDSIKFNLELSPDLPLVEFDGSQLQQLFVNLLNNAADALRERKSDRIIDIATHFDATGNVARVVVEDNAGGLPEDLNEVIFKQRYTGKRRGRGFGLMIIKRIIDIHHGQITYTSVPVEGTTFTISLPIKTRLPVDETATRESPQVTT